MKRVKHGEDNTEDPSRSLVGVHMERQKRWMFAIDGSKRMALSLEDRAVDLLLKVEASC
jgi:hypothetical protein